MNRTDSILVDPKQDHRVSVTPMDEEVCIHVIYADSSPYLSNHPQIDEFIEQNIQINSNKEIRREYLNAWTLKFIDKNQEQKFCQLREDMFRCVWSELNVKGQLQ